MRLIFFKKKKNTAHLFQQHWFSKIATQLLLGFEVFEACVLHLKAVPKGRLPPKTVQTITQQCVWHHRIQLLPPRELFGRMMLIGECGVQEG